MNKKKVLPITAVLVGVILIGLGAGLGWAAFPEIVKSQIEENIDLTKEDTEGYKNFITPPVPVYIKFTFFHVLNPEKVVLNEEKAKFEEKGPYAYREVREKRNLKFGSGILDFEQYRHFEFDESKSCAGCKKTDRVRILNMVLIGAVHQAMGLGSIQAIAGLNMLARGIDNTPNSKDLFLEETVDNLLLAGVTNKLVNITMTTYGLKTMLPPAIQDNGFAIFNTKNATTLNECYRVDTGVERHSEILLWGPDANNLTADLSTMRTCPSKLESIKPPPKCSTATFKSWWPYPDITGEVETSPCNAIRGTNGEQFPPFLEERKEEDIWIFTTDLCRSLNLRYLEDYDIDGIKTLRYSVPKDSTNVNKTNNVCFCKELAKKWDDPCIKKIDGSDELDIKDCKITTCHDGLQDVSQCMLSPVIMSSPHFYLAEAQLNNFDESIKKPVEAEDMTYLDIEPNTGMVLSVHKKIQINMPITPTGKDNIIFLKNITEVAAFPVLWLDEGADIDQENIDKIKSMVTTPLLILDVVKYALIGLGAAAVLLGAALFFLLK